MRDRAALEFTLTQTRSGNSRHRIILLHKVSEINRFTQKMFMSKIDIIITKCQGHTDSYSSIVKILRDNVQAFQVPL